jgi:dolichyl-phosphate beta-glucosyltransferase
MIGLIIPCYNFSAEINTTLTTISNWRTGSALPIKMCVVDDGSSDDTFQLLSAFAQENKTWVFPLKLNANMGKGKAVRTAVQILQNDCEKIIFTDCDLHYGLDIITKKIIPELDLNDIVIADRSWMEKGRGANCFRTLYSAVFNRLVSILTGVNFKDTQAGLKGFKTATTKPLFSLLTLNSFSFDVEILSIALFYRLRIKQIPVSYPKEYSFPEESRVRVIRHSILMLIDLIKINFNWKRGKYFSKELSESIDRDSFEIS